MYIRQHAQFDEILVQLRGSKRSSYTTSQLSSGRDDSQSDRLCDQSQNRSGERRNEMNAAVTQLQHFPPIKGRTQIVERNM